MKGKKKYNLEELIAQGYCRVSNRHLTVARIDRADWKEHMAREHSPRDPEGAGKQWVELIGPHNAADHYRRCYSNDKVQFDPREEQLYKRFPGSGEPEALREFTGVDRRVKEVKVVVPVVSARQVELARREGHTAGEHGAPSDVNPYKDNRLAHAWEQGRQDAVFEEDYQSVSTAEAHKLVESNLKTTAWVAGAFLLALAVLAIAGRVL